MIEIRDLWKSFGDNHVLKGINLTIPKGGTFVVLGGSGSGKTVLMKHVIGLLKPDRGAVRVNGLEISSLEGKALTEARGAHAEADALSEQAHNDGLRLGIADADAAAVLHHIGRAFRNGSLATFTSLLGAIEDASPVQAAEVNGTVQEAKV